MNFLYHRHPFFLIIYYAIINPIVIKKKAQIDDMNKKRQETQKNLSDIKSMKSKIVYQTGVNNFELDNFLSLCKPKIANNI